MFQRRWGIPLGGGIIVLAALAAYHRSFAVPFLMDDGIAVVDNVKIRHLWPIWDALSPSATSVVGGRPVVNLSFAVNYALGGTAVWGYHALNLAVHILAALILYGIVRRSLLAPALRERFGACATRLALAVAVVWTVHPLQTEAVTYVSERCESLMALFYLLTLYCFIRGSDSRRCGWWLTLSVVACLLGVASKEVMVTAPVMVLLYDRTFVSGSFREAWMRHRRLYLGLASTWVLLGYLMVGLHYRGAGYAVGIPWWSYALVECRVVVQYLWLALWPHPLVFDYGEFVTVQHNGGVALYAALLAILIAVVLVELKRRPAIGFVGAWFLVILAPTSSVVPVAGLPMAEHRMYLPLAAVVTLAAVGAVNTLTGRRGAAALLALAVGLGWLTARRNEDYRSELSIWTDTVAKCPDNARAHTNLGRALQEANRFPEALSQCEEALQINPGNAQIHYNLANALVRLGRLPEAIAQYEFALRINPDYVLAQNNLAWHLATHVPAEGGDPVRAVALAERACRLSDDRVAKYLDTLAAAYAAAGRFGDAVDTAQKAIQLADSTAQTQLISKIEMRLELYRANQPYFEPRNVAAYHNP